MKAVIVDLHGPIGRTQWIFSLVINFGDSYIYLDSYSFQTKESPRHKKWHAQTIWTRLDKRSNNIDSPPLDTDIEARAKLFFADQIKSLPIRR